MAFDKPTRVARFGGTSSTEAANSAEPSSGKKDLGWVLGETLPGSFLNWLSYRAYKWFRWVDERLIESGAKTSLRLNPPAVENTSDDGGSLTLASGDAGGDDDTDGGDIVIEAGDSVGSGSSSITMLAATAGSSGAVASPAEQYVKADGPNERVVVNKKLLVSVPAGDADPGVLIASDTDYSIQTLHTATDKGPLSMGLMGSEPTGPNAVGDLYIATGGVLKICTAAGSPGTWVSVGAQT